MRKQSLLLKTSGPLVYILFGLSPILSCWCMFFGIRFSNLSYKTPCWVVIVCIVGALQSWMFVFERVGFGVLKLLNKVESRWAIVSGLS